MPRIGMEPQRRAALVQATIDEVGQAGSLDVTVSRIARRAGVSSALAHHYFGAKDALFLAAMRHILALFVRSVRHRLARANSSRYRLDAVIQASFDADQFEGHVVNAWLNFYVAAQTSPDAKRLLRAYHARLRSNLLANLRPLMGAGAEEAADTIAALIDGFYIRAALGPDALDSTQATRRVMALAHLMLAREA
ncbi:MAG: transcriptional regulator BetI [Pseudomonadota bacterium]